MVDLYYSSMTTFLVPDLDVVSGLSCFPVIRLIRQGDGMRTLRREEWVHSWVPFLSRPGTLLLSRRTLELEID